MVLVCRIKRVEKVSCAHRLHSTALTDEENKVSRAFFDIGDSDVGDIVMLVTL